MAKRVYIGSSNSSKRIKNMYVGVSGSSRRIIKGYIGVSGTAKQFYPAYAWNKYTVRAAEYGETLGSEQEISSWNPGIMIGNTGYPAAYCYTSYTFNKSTGKYSFSGWDTPPVNYGYTDVTGYYYDNYALTRTYGFNMIGSGRHSSTAYGRFMSSTLTTTEGPGTRVGLVFSNESNTYPTNGKHTDGYWYIRI